MIQSTINNLINCNTLSFYSPFYTSRFGKVNSLIGICNGVNNYNNITVKSTIFTLAISNMEEYLWPLELISYIIRSLLRFKLNCCSLMYLLFCTKYVQNYVHVAIVYMRNYAHCLLRRYYENTFAHE